MGLPKIPQEIISDKLSRYKLDRQIGSGGMGEIFKACDQLLKRDVAIKFISNEVRNEEIRKTVQARFLNEARAAAKLPHPNLVQVYDFVETQTHSFIIMELVAGETLSDRLKLNQQLGYEELLRIARDISAGLAFAHKNGVVHRDVKPSNIIVEMNTKICKLLDFGIAKFIDEEQSKLTSTGVIIGSVHYLSPEHILAQNIDGRSDIFSLGTVLYELATGVRPFRGQNAMSIYDKILHLEHEPITAHRNDLPIEFMQIVDKCLAKNPNSRFQSGSEIEVEILKLKNQTHSDLKNKSENASSRTLKTIHVTDQMLMSFLRRHNRITEEQKGLLAGGQVLENILNYSIMSEDELAKCISDCLNSPWIPLEQLNQIKIPKRALESVSKIFIEKWNVLPLSLDIRKQVLSLIIDGWQDFREDPEFGLICGKYRVQCYIASRSIIRQMINENFNFSS